MEMLDLVVAILTEGLLGFVSLSRAQNISKEYYAGAIVLSPVEPRETLGDGMLGVDSLGLPKKRGERLQDAMTGWREATGIESSETVAISYEFT